MKTNIIIYDGFCRFCNGIVNWLIKIIDPADFTIIPCHLTGNYNLIFKIDEKECNKFLHIITKKNQLFKGADAIREIWLRSHHWSKPIAFLLKLPVFIHIARIFYSFVSNHRLKFYRTL